MADNHSSDVHVEFFVDAIENPAKSAEAGRAIFEDKEMVRIRFPGDKNRELVAPANQQCTRDPHSNTWLTYIDRFPRHYEAFKRNAAYIGDGTPLNEAPFLTASQKAELHSLNIHTLEALAGMSSAAIASFGLGGRGLVNQAQAWIEKASGSAVEMRLAQENAELKARFDMLEKQLQQAMNAGIVRPSPVAEISGPSPFEEWADDDLKALIKDKTGSAPRGNPAHSTLVRMADELNAQSQAA